MAQFCGLVNTEKTKELEFLKDGIEYLTLKFFSEVCVGENSFEAL